MPSTRHTLKPSCGLVKLVEERLAEDAIWKMDKHTIQKEAKQVLLRFKVSEEYFQEKYVYKYNQDGQEYRYKGDNKINSQRQDWH
ncbi:hypothetical protein ElyMa_002133600 [Elysia marginata]|uniref:Dynein light chain n=1 Tax=Elysia marginata TaxID=1093978 RepID=A0AAV4FKN5_9GAST|nr:hypothetical protein ElyMa_002133600 [Elysia marginata]